MNNLSTTSAMVLHSVASGCGYGFEIMDRTGLPSGSVYPVLRRFEEAGFLRSSWEAEEASRQAKRPRRKYYQISARGRQALAEARQRFPWLVGLSSGPGGIEPSVT